MNKAVITILGTLGKKENFNFEPKKLNFIEKVRYFFNNDMLKCTKIVTSTFPKAKYKSQVEEIKETENINTLPILIDTFQKNGYEIISLYTEFARSKQEEVLKHLNIEYEFKPKWEIKNETDFDAIFSQIDSIIDDYDEVILDVSHGFRHLPILAIVDAIIHNLKDTERITKILFAKEIIFQKEYEFIDLKRYLDLANISYALNTFNRNYTVASNITVSDKNFTNILNSLSELSKHILANSIYALLEDTNERISVITRLQEEIEKILNSDDNDKVYSSVKRPLGIIKTHIDELYELRTKSDYEKMFFLSKNMYERGYLLNSITLLSEAVGMLCMNEIKKLDDSIKSKVQDYEDIAIMRKDEDYPIFKLYDLYKTSKGLYKFGDRYRSYGKQYLKVAYNRDYLDGATVNMIRRWNIEVEPLEDKIREFFSHTQRDENLVELIGKIDRTRNNLAHANTSQRLDNVSNEIKSVLNAFEQVLINLNEGEQH